MTNIQIQLSKLKENQSLKLSPEGLSMYPFIVGKRDDVYVIPADDTLKKGDLALYYRSNGQYVIHRVYRVKNTPEGIRYYMLGDHQTDIEGPLTCDSIHGKVIAIKRKGKYIVCESNKLYIFLAKLWLLIRPLRPVLFKLDALRRRLKNH